MLKNKPFKNTRLGYACINTELKKHKVCCNRTCRLDTAIKKGVESNFPKGSEEYSLNIYEFLCEYGRNNLIEMYKIISWSRKHDIYFYRMSSDMFPHINNTRIQEHMLPEHWKKYESLEFAIDIIEQIGLYVQKYGIRLTMHPCHYNQLATPKKSVLENTITDLAWHSRLLDLLQVGAEAYIQHLKNTNRPVTENVLKHGVLCIHGGGTYGDKPAAIKRWCHNFKNLPKNIQNRICVENDERGYNVEDLLPICKQLNIPLIFDFHHYNCWRHYHLENGDQLPISELLPQILKTWERRNIIPKFHLSDQAKDKRVGAHHDYVESIPKELLLLMEQNYKFDIVIEAKMKEKAVQKLYEKYKK